MSRVPPSSHAPRISADATSPDNQASARGAAPPREPRPSSGAPRGRADRQAFFHWIGRRVQQTQTVANVAVSPAHDADVQLEQRRHVLTLLDRSVELVDCADRCLGADGNTDSGDLEKAALLKELSAHWKEIRQLTVVIENEWVGDPEHGLAQDRPTLTMGAPAAGGMTTVDAIVARCLDITDALPRLCIAASRKPTDSGRLTGHYFEINEKLPLGADLEDMLVHAALAQTVYSEDLDANLARAHAHAAYAAPPTWERMAITETLRAGLRAACATLRELDDGRLCDPASGLVMQLFENHDTHKIVLAFGGTTAGEAKGPLLTRLLSNPWITATQWRANLAGATGLSLLGGPVPDCYSAAAQLARAVAGHLQDTRPDGRWAVSLTGHSKGGAEAEFAALQTGLRAACFGTPELGRGVLATASTEQLKAGACNIRHYFVRGDVAPVVSTALAHVLPERFAHVGTGYWMEPTPDVGTLPLSRNLWCHDLFFDSALQEAVRQSAAAEHPPASQDDGAGRAAAPHLRPAS